MISKRFADFLNRLRQGEQEQDRERLAAILQLNRALAGAQGLQGVLDLLLDEAIRLFGAERGFVILQEGKELKAGLSLPVAAARSLDREPVRNPSGKISSTVVGQSLAEEQAVFSEDAQAGDLAAAASVADINLRSVLCAPVMVGEQTLGCIYLDHRFQAKVFGEDDLPWFQAFADQCAITLHLHKLLDERKAHLQAIAAQNQDLSAQVAEQAQELSALRLRLSRDSLTHSYPEIVGEAPSLLRSLHLIDRLVDSVFPVLITGESGTGKELAARALHQNGPRRDGPFVAVNVAAITPSLMESELFGHCRGAFTGADRDRVGLLQQAHGGVLFLDEVTEMELETQAKFLRFLEDGMVRSVGAQGERRVDLRIVAATNRDPQLEVKEGRFRADLFYRLAVVKIELPPLRERLADIPELVRLFLQQAASSVGRDRVRKASVELLRRITGRAWPGNLRELRNEVLRLDALADDDVIGPELLSRPAATPSSPELNLGRLEQWAIEQALQGAGGNKSEAARLLGISRRALYNKIERGRE